MNSGSLGVAALQSHATHTAKEGNTNQAHVEPSTKERREHAIGNITAVIIVVLEVCSDAHGLPKDPNDGNTNVDSNPLVVTQDLLDATPRHVITVVSSTAFVHLLVQSSRFEIVRLLGSVRNGSSNDGRFGGLLFATIDIDLCHLGSRGRSSGRSCSIIDMDKVIVLFFSNLVANVKRGHHVDGRKCTCCHHPTRFIRTVASNQIRNTLNTKSKDRNIETKCG
mmetsp:Transcript_31486/g.51992  ORF Transcript_31486/g.51992 Transcript_31486/m.51992 type:complete len:223 (+) Transcript_31486:161-829(+)